MRRHIQRQHDAAAQRWSGIRSSLIAICLGMIALVPLVLTACGGTAPARVGETPLPGGHPTQQPGGEPTVTVGQSTPSPQVSYTYLYSRVDYPLQVKVDGGDTVTLTLSPYSSILSVAPTPGSGTGTVGSPISLPTDLQNYDDIGASVDTVSNGSGPITWQLISAPRQTLLNNPTFTPRKYLDSVTFRWQVQAVSAGQNTAEILLRIYYVYLDGSEHDGTIQVSQSAIPMVAVAASPVDSLLASFKLPLAGLSWLAGIIAIIRFFYGALKTVNDVAEPVKDAAHVARAVHGRLSRDPQREPRR